MIPAAPVNYPRYLPYHLFYDRPLLPCQSNFLRAHGIPPRKNRPLETENLNSFRTRKEAAIHCVNNRLSTNLPTAKEPPVQAFDGVLATLDSVELEIDVTLAIGFERNVNDVAVLFLAFGLDIFFSLFDPGVALLSEEIVSRLDKYREDETYSVGLKQFFRSTQRLAWLTVTGRALVSVLGLAILRCASAVESAESSVLASLRIKASLL